MERMRKEFDDLRIEMEKETETKRSEISNLNGEVVEKASLLSSRDREFLQLAANMDELKLQHKTEVASLRREINEFGANEKEVQRAGTPRKRHIVKPKLRRRPASSTSRRRS